MRQLFASAWVIARRDYVSTVFSRIFLLFLLTPVFPVIFGGVFASLGTDSGPGPSAPVVAVVANAGDAQHLTAARDRLVRRLGPDALPRLSFLPPGQKPATWLLEGERRYDALLVGVTGDPHFTLAAHAPASLSDDVGLIVDTARADAALGERAPPPVDLGTARAPSPPGDRKQDGTGIAKAAQTGLFIILVMLAGMSLSTFIEEKSNKVIEVLAAAVPVDAIFLGKLCSMLAIALTFVGAWSVVIAGGVLAFKPAIVMGLPVPAVGWPAFVALLIAYFVGNYLLLGAVFLGIGSQAGSPREVQVMALPVTMLQLVLYGFASAGVAHPDRWVSIAAAIFPWSSPLAMIARAAELPALWPHLLALAWQILWLVLALRVAAAMFRRAVLKSGGGWRWWSRSKTAEAVSNLGVP
ncbi:ABC transporter permease [Sphingomonas oryzagri]|uniref:ABC transporter permease n=1 Tax=Sphingomonas oryzagri TaxID=3042314 RepID=A0ABT6N3J7_9SPHN|nr:ABC transporter permease [Sphingomonas oryzagri]MDH7639879.1 ABC transporter permease [Sphingomonas oryzagri]